MSLVKVSLCSHLSFFNNFREPDFDLRNLSIFTMSQLQMMAVVLYGFGLPLPLFLVLIRLQRGYSSMTLLIVND